MRPSIVSPDPIDYVARWRQLVTAREHQGRRLDPEFGRGDHWAGERALRFRRIAARAARSDALLELIRPHLTPSTTILDVGAGTGRHVVPLAPLAAQVTAVEPSPAMRAQLEAVVQEQGLANVRIVASQWPVAEVEPADIVICSHVAYVVSEIAPFLRRLDEVNRGRCYVVLRHVQREIAILDLFERIWGEPRCQEPTFTDLFGVASQLGIWANVATIPFGVAAEFESIDDAVAWVRADLLNPVGPSVDSTIREYLNERMICRDGKWTFPTPPMVAGVLWWEARD